MDGEERVGGVTPDERAARQARRAQRDAAAGALDPAERAARRERRARRAARLAVSMQGRAPRPARPLARQPIETIYQDDDLAISRMGDPAARRAVICFAGIGAGCFERGRFAMALGGIQPAEFVGTAQLEDSVVYHVADIRRSWFNGFAPERLLDVLAPLVAGKPIVTLGNSMGAFGAIWFSTLLPVEVVLAFAPQFSVHLDIMPDEHRWREWTDRITAWRVPSLGECFVPRTRYYTFNGEQDRLHWSRFPALSNARHFLIDGADHKAALHVKAAGALAPVIHTCLADGDPLAVMTSAGLAVTEIAA